VSSALICEVGALGAAAMEVGMGSLSICNKKATGEGGGLRAFLKTAFSVRLLPVIIHNLAVFIFRVE